MCIHYTCTLYSCGQIYGNASCGSVLWGLCIASRLVRSHPCSLDTPCSPYTLKHTALGQHQPFYNSIYLLSCLFFEQMMYSFKETLQVIFVFCIATGCLASLCFVNVSFAQKQACEGWRAPVTLLSPEEVREPHSFEGLAITKQT